MNRFIFLRLRKLWTQRPERMRWRTLILNDAYFPEGLYAII